MTGNNAARLQKDNVRSISDKDRRLEHLLEHLKSELDGVHVNDPELHQLWLETQWLQSNLRSDVLCLPRNWELIIFRMVRGNTALFRYPAALRAARDLAECLRSAVPKCE